MAWVIADGLTTTFTCCVDTIYISAFVDIEANNPPKFLSNDLREGFGLDRAEEEAPAGATKLYRPVDGTSTLTLTPPPTPTPTLTLSLTLTLTLTLTQLASGLVCWAGLGGGLSAWWR